MLIFCGIKTIWFSFNAISSGVINELLKVIIMGYKNKEPKIKDKSKLFFFILILLAANKFI